MKLFVLIVLVVVALGVSAPAWAGSYSYAGHSNWPAGQAHSTWFASSWWNNIFSKSASFDTTITFIDNTSYGWHSTVRGWATYQQTHWFSSAVKKAHCRANTSASAWAACTAYN